MVDPVKSAAEGVTKGLAEVVGDGIKRKLNNNSASVIQEKSSTGEKFRVRVEGHEECEIMKDPETGASYKVCKTPVVTKEAAKRLADKSVNRDKEESEGSIFKLIFGE